MFNFSTRRVGGIRFIKLGRLCFSFCLMRKYKPLAHSRAQTKGPSHHDTREISASLPGRA